MRDGIVDYCNDSQWIVYLWFQVKVTRARWFDLPFTREESLTADKKITLHCK